jgi:hypothetical protein
MKKTSEKTSRQTTMLLRFDAMRKIMDEVENFLLKRDGEGALAAIRVYKETYSSFDAKMFDAEKAHNKADQPTFRYEKPSWQAKELRFPEDWKW